MESGLLDVWTVRACDLLKSRCHMVIVYIGLSLGVKTM